MDDIIQEVANGEGMPLDQARHLIPPFRAGHPTTSSCLFRWVSDGVRLGDGGVVRLEAVRLAGRLLTTKKAIQRFLRAQTPVVDDHDGQQAVGNPGRRTKAHAQASTALAERYGL